MELFAFEYLNYNCVLFFYFVCYAMFYYTKQTDNFHTAFRNKDKSKIQIMFL